MIVFDGYKTLPCQRLKRHINLSNSMSDVSLRRPGPNPQFEYHQPTDTA
ncbi:MAG: hypothetical protein H7319_17180 [Spirosoma sp.]|nr:hypothetical protein [Spirosoma sp.]